MVTSVVPPGLKDPKTLVKEGDAILGELCGWGVRVAIGELTSLRLDQDWHLNIFIR